MYSKKISQTGIQSWNLVKDCIICRDFFLTNWIAATDALCRADRKLFSRLIC